MTHAQARLAAIDESKVDREYLLSAASLLLACEEVSDDDFEAAQDLIERANRKPGAGK